MKIPTLFVGMMVAATTAASAQTVSSLTSASLPLTGTEMTYLIQNGVSKQTAVSNLTTGGVPAPFNIGSGGVALTAPALQATGTYNSTFQLSVQNLSGTGFASSDLVATANDGTDTTFYVDLGINGSGYSDPTFSIAGAHDGYLYSQSSNLAIGTGTAGKNVILFVGGTLAANKVATISAAGLAVIGVIALTPVTVASLPTCNTAAKGNFLAVTDATTPTYNATLVGGGAVSVPAYCNGTNWISY